MTGTLAPQATSAPSRTPVLAILGFGVSAVLSCIGTFWSLNDTPDAQHSASDWLFSLAIAAVGAAVVFGLVVRTASAGNPERRALVLSLFGVLSIAVFWSGLPSVFIAGATACALTHRDAQGSFGALSKIALTLSAMTGAAAVALALLG